MNRLTSAFVTALIVPMVAGGLAGCTAPGEAPRSVPLHSATTPVDREHPWWKERTAGIQANVDRGDARLIFIGDSITQGWGSVGWSTWESFYVPRGGVNLGISGDRTQHVLWRLQNGHLDGIDPELAVIMIGTNNAGDNTSQEIADGVEAIVNTVQEKLPDTEVLILAIFPRGATPEDLRRRVNDGATAIFAALAERDGVEFLDIGDAFLSGDGTLPKDVMPDLLHLTPEAYQTWAVEIEDHVNEAVGPLPR